MNVPPTPVMGGPPAQGFFADTSVNHDNSFTDIPAADQQQPPAENTNNVSLLGLGGDMIMGGQPANNNNVLDNSLLGLGEGGNMMHNVD